jgi:hypothetical protein
MLACRGGIPHFQQVDHSQCESNGRTEIVRLLLEAGANPELQEGSFGMSSVMLATRTGCIPILQVFLEHCKRGGKIFDVCLEQSDFSPLMSAVEVGELEVVKWMLASGADPTTRTPLRKMTALAVATSTGKYSHPRPEIAKVLETFMEEKEGGGGGGGGEASAPSRTLVEGEQWDVEEVARRLKEAGVQGEVIETFRKEEIDGKALLTLTDSEWQLMGISIGEKKKIKRLTGME